MTEATPAPSAASASSLQTAAAPVPASAVSVRKACEADLPRLSELIPSAFSAHFGRSVASDANFAMRFYARNCRAWVAEVNGEIKGVIFLTLWGSFAFFGPLCVDPAAWGQRIAQELLAVMMDACKSEGVTGMAIYTMPDSPKHLHLYSKISLWPRWIVGSI